ncbi:MAG TPA: T9SS type A sorting domain-containing protein [Bacteroidota bacterium]
MKRLVLASTILSLCGLLVLSSTAAQAQILPSPLKLSVVKVEMSGDVTLAWTKPDTLVFAKYYVYAHNAMSMMAMPMVPVDSADGTASGVTIKLPPSPIGGSITYAIVVAGVLPNGSRINSNEIDLPFNGVPPTNAFRLEAKVSGFDKVILVWNAPAQVTVTQYDIYRSTIDPEVMPVTLTSLIRIGSTTDTMATDSGMATNVYYGYYVMARTSTNDSVRSSLAVVFVEGMSLTDKVTFTSTPVTSARVGVPYDYRAAAVSNDSSAIIRYRLSSESFDLDDGITWDAQGITIDSVSGELTFTPTHRGWLPVRIVAQSSKGGRAFQQFTITISGGNGVLTGKVTDTLSHPIANVMVEAYRRNSDDWFSFRTRTDSLGNYRITSIDPSVYVNGAVVPSTEYYVHAIPLSHDYFGQWYNGANSADQATAIAVPDSPAVATADFRLRSRNTVSLRGTVAGSVTDTSGLAITQHGTVVFFVNADFAVNSASDFRGSFDFDRDSDARLDGDSHMVFKTRVDSLGHYTMKIPAGKYIAFAKSPGYSIEFYNDKSDILSADVITVFPDIMAIPVSPTNFSLVPLPPVVLGQISGQVEDTVKNVGVRARVIAFRDRWSAGVTDDFDFQHTYVTDADSTGNYTFTNLLPGSYIILAVPLGNYAPVFYNNGTQTLSWKNATRITVNGNVVTGINIFVKPIPDSARGFTLISGNVSASSGSAAGAIVYATYANGDIAGYAFADANGNYTISGIAPGTYTVNADLSGYMIAGGKQASPTYGPNGGPVPASANLSAQPLTGVTTPSTGAVPTTYMLEQNYPNPFNPSTTINYSLPSPTRVVLKVFNMLGQEVETLVNQVQTAGKYQVVFRAANLASGVYFYQLHAGNSLQTKKMLLMK